MNIHRSKDCKELYEELKDMAIMHLTKNTKRYYIIRTTETIGFQNMKSSNSPIINQLYERVFKILFNDGHARENIPDGEITWREMHIVNRKEVGADTLSVFEPHSRRTFKISDQRIEHNIPHYFKVFIDKLNVEQYEEAIVQDYEQIQRRFALASATHNRLGADSGLLGEIINAGLYPYMGLYPN